MSNQKTEGPSPLGESTEANMTHAERMRLLTAKYRGEYDGPLYIPEYEESCHIVKRIYERVLQNETLNRRLLQAPEPDQPGYPEAVMAIGRDLLGDVSDLGEADWYANALLGFFIDVRARGLSRNSRGRNNTSDNGGVSNPTRRSGR